MNGLIIFGVVMISQFVAAYPIDTRFGSDASLAAFASSDPDDPLPMVPGRESWYWSSLVLMFEQPEDRIHGATLVRN